MTDPGTRPGSFGAGDQIRTLDINLGVNSGMTASYSTCIVCSKEFKYLPSRSHGKFCSNACCGANKRKESQSKFDIGTVMDRSIQRRLVIERDGYQCSVCEISEWQGKPISLHMDHIDGNPGNNMPDNFRMICPNCHSQTESYGAKNKGKGRKALGLPTR